MNAPRTSAINAAAIAASAAALLAAPAHAANPITVMISGILGADSGFDGDPVRLPSAGLEGASFTLEADLAPNTVYERSLNLPAAGLGPTATLEITTAADAALDGIYNAAFYPTLAGVLAYDGFFNGFDAQREDGTTLNVFGMLIPAVGAQNAEVGRTIETDDFHGATNNAFAVSFGQTEYVAQTLTVEASSVPTPAAAAFLGLAGLTATRRRR
mgnify:CR=1 FL=1